MTSATPASVDLKKIRGDAKCPMELIPVVASTELARSLQEGANKYGPYNWRASGIMATTYVAAMMRHLDAWRAGQDIDPDSGRSHLGHIMANCAIVLDAIACGRFNDNRYKDVTP